MIPQSSFMVVAAIAPGKESALRQLLLEMNRQPGVADPQNPLVPFGRLDTLHFARFVILNDLTLEDITVYNRPVVNYPLSLAFLGDFDGSYEAFIRDLVAVAGGGLGRIFSHCGFTPGSDLAAWIRGKEHHPATYYANWRGRTVKQCREEAALRALLIKHIDDAGLRRLPASELNRALRKFVRGEQAAGRLTLSPEPPTPFGWRIKNTLHAVFAVPVILAALLLWGVVILLRVRTHEKRDPEICPRPSHEHAAKLAELEDHGLSNQFSAMGTLKPGIFRAVTLRLLLWVIDYTTRHVYTRGRLARVHTIHFARWVYIDGGKRLYFASNYDGSLESYMDDFINKVAFGLNVVFGNGIGYPRTSWMILDGAKDEQKFKYYIRRHQLPTEVWYNAHEGFTAFDLEANSRIRKGLEGAAMNDREVCEWASLL